MANLARAAEGAVQTVSIAILRWFILAVAGLVIAMTWSGASEAAPFLPTSDSDVLERLPAVNLSS